MYVVAYEWLLFSRIFWYCDS